MAELDGVWSVERTSGLLPPLLGVRKRIAGTRGTTLVADGRVSAPFDVVGTELHYRTPFAGFVDVLARGGDGFDGRFTFRGRVLGRFTLTRIEQEPIGSLTAQLVKHIDEAHALEQNVLRLLDGMISTTEDAELLQALERHRTETEGHARDLRERLEAHGAAPSTVRQAAGILGALAKLPLDLMRGEKSARNARDGFAAEHMEIASYELLKRVAQRAFDEETVAVCDRIIAEEQAMADAIAVRWDAVTDLSLREAGAEPVS